MNKLYQTIKIGSSCIQSIMNARFTHKRGSSQEYVTDLETQILKDKHRLLRAGYSVKSTRTGNYDAVLYFSNEYISYYQMENTQVISFDFSGCYLAVCNCTVNQQQVYYAFHIPPNRIGIFYTLVEELRMKLCACFRPTLLIYGRRTPDNLSISLKIWGIIDIRNTKAYAIQVNEDYKIATFNPNIHMCKEHMIQDIRFY